MVIERMPYCNVVDTLSHFFFNETATTEIYTLSLHDALPISQIAGADWGILVVWINSPVQTPGRSEEHTSELQSRRDLVCRLLLEKKKHNNPLHRIQEDHHIPHLPLDGLLPLVVLALHVLAPV